MKIVRFLAVFLLLPLLAVYTLPVPAEAACTFTEQNMGTAPGATQATSLADLDGDGDVDIIFAGYTDDTIFWYENDGAQQFTQRILDDEAVNPFYVDAADFDGDDDIDVVHAEYSSLSLILNVNDGAGNFTEDLTAFASPPTTGSLHALSIDFDGDDDIDVVSATSAGDLVFWYENDGAANFTRRNVGTQDGPESVYAIDVDSDGDMDVLAASWSDNAVAWYENDGTDQAFTKHVIDSTTDVARFVTAADLDGDGDVDVLVPEIGNSGTFWYENDGSENFTKTVVSTTDGTPIRPVDIDGDGDQDILTGSPTVGWYENDGAANFTRRTIGSVALGSTSSADIDGNGKVDVVGVSGTAIYMFLQSCSSPTSSDPSPPNTSLDVTITIDQADPEMNELTVTDNTPFTLSTKIPDPDQLQDIYFRVNGTKYPLQKSDKTGYYTLDLNTIDLPLGTHNYTLTANWGTTTRTIYGTITITPKPQSSPFIILINQLFRSAYQREITMTEWQYWANRLLDTNFSSIQTIFGAMQWQALFGGGE